MEVEIVQVAEDRYQALDRRGALLQSFGSKGEAEAFRTGYRLGREDATRIVRNALEPLPERVGMSRG